MPRFASPPAFLTSRACPLSCRGATATPGIQLTGPGWHHRARKTVPASQTGNTTPYTTHDIPERAGLYSLTQARTPNSPRPWQRCGAPMPQWAAGPYVDLAGTAAAQLLDEVGEPAYLNPEVTVYFDAMRPLRLEPRTGAVDLQLRAVGPSTASGRRITTQTAPAASRPAELPPVVCCLQLSDPEPSRPGFHPDRARYTIGIACAVTVEKARGRDGVCGIQFVWRWCDVAGRACPRSGQVCVYIAVPG